MLPLLPFLPDAPSAGERAHSRMTLPAFASVVLDIESTISSVEGINWLASRRSPDVAGEIADLTERAMHGEIPYESVYGERLARVRPTSAEIAELAELYRGRVAPDAIEVIDELRAAGVRLVLVSGGIREALLPLAFSLGFTNAELYAVRVSFDARGEYAGYDERSPLASSNGKSTVVQRLYLPRPLLAVGDGATDLAMRPVADAFAAFTGFTRRLSVVRCADHELTSFADLRALVFG